MTAPEEAVETAIDVVSSDGRGFGLAIGAFLLGTGIGGGIGYILTKRKLADKYGEIADAEIEEMREHFHAKSRALESTHAKGDLSEIVKEKGYKSPEPDISDSPPMAVQPPASVTVVEAPTDDSEMSENDVEGPNGVKPQVRNVFRERERSTPHEWDLQTELKRRSPTQPYVIHYDERHELEGYSEASLTYYAGDDVLCNERDEVIDPETERDILVGEANLERFGHGNPDPMIVFVRNDNLEIVYEIIKSPNSYAEEVHGFTHQGWDHGNLEKMRRRERDAEN